MSQLGTEAAPLRVAVVGAGPSGFYATEALLKSEIAAQVDLIERLPSPYGLVRSGVAPDHPKLKQSIEVYKKVAALEGFHFFGNVTVGKDVTPQELRDIYHAVIYTCGAETDRRLGIEGEDLAGSHTATEFVGWYNGHPDYRDREFNFSHETAVIIGQGNVAADVARILSKSVDELKHTDISQHALDALAESQIKTIAVVGRRGPAQAKFTTKELREFLELENCQAAIASEELALNEASQTEVADKKAGVVAAKNMAVFEKMAESAEHGKARTCRMMFCRSPIRIEGNGRIDEWCWNATSCPVNRSRNGPRARARPKPWSAGCCSVPLATGGCPSKVCRSMTPGACSRIKRVGSPMARMGRSCRASTRRAGSNVDPPESLGPIAPVQCRQSNL